jgi:hypothetical protein
MAVLDGQGCRTAGWFRATRLPHRLTSHTRADLVCLGTCYSRYSMQIAVKASIPAAKLCNSLLGGIASLSH